MKVAKDWLKELVEIKSIKEVEKLLPLKTIGTKEITSEFIELDMKGYNRADLLSLRGVAYEVAAIIDSSVKFQEPEETTFAWVQQNFPEVKVEIEDENLCPVYCVAKLEGLKVNQSDPGWKKRLEDSGTRSINNVADITNLAMLEYGQPLHAFDARAVKDETIIVRTAKKGERITTLDGKTRDLEETDLLIADPQNALGIAGVMGGKDSEITDSTTTILLEAAIFDPVSIRKTATRLGLQSEASKRFYHGLTKKRLLQSLNAAIRMYQNLGGKLTGLTVVGNPEDQLKKVHLTLEKTNSLIGVDLTAEQVEDYLKKLNFDLVGPHPGGGSKNLASIHPWGVSWVVTPPYWRLDISIEEDLIEEVARMYGYEKIPAKELPGKPPPTIDQKLFELFELIYNLKKSLADQGLTEVQTYSFYSTDVLNNLDLDTEQLVKVANPISKETEYLRNELWPNLVEVVGKNLRHGFSDIAIFEVGKVYQVLENDRPKEIYRLSAALSRGGDKIVTELYQIMEEVMTNLGLMVNLGKNPITEQEKDLFHPNGVFHLARYGHKDDGEEIGLLAEIHKRITDKFGIGKRVAVLELGLEKLL